MATPDSAVIESAKYLQDYFVEFLNILKQKNISADMMKNLMPHIDSIEASAQQMRRDIDNQKFTLLQKSDGSSSAEVQRDINSLTLHVPSA